MKKHLRENRLDYFGGTGARCIVFRYRYIIFPKNSSTSTYKIQHLSLTVDQLLSCGFDFFVRGEGMYYFFKKINNVPWGSTLFSATGTLERSVVLATSLSFRFLKNVNYRNTSFLLGVACLKKILPSLKRGKKITSSEVWSVSESGAPLFVHFFFANLRSLAGRSKKKKKKRNRNTINNYGSASAKIVHGFKKLVKKVTEKDLFPFFRNMPLAGKKRRQTSFPQRNHICLIKTHASTTLRTVTKLVLPHEASVK